MRIPSLPDRLTELDRWVLWRMERIGRDTKVPYSVRGFRASSTDPRSWASFEEVRAAWERNPGRYAGVGFVFVQGDQLVGIDLDDCLDSDGLPKNWAHGVIQRFFDTYMEISPSGQGIKIWAGGTLPANLPGVRVGDGQIEMYDHARYFTVTGRAFRGAPIQVEDHTEDILRLHERLASPRKQWSAQPLGTGRIPRGQQHNTLVSIAGTLRARRVCDEAIEACLQAINEHQCEQPGPRQHITRIVRSSRSWVHR
jgi:primase-polymerase (primpol)-like protein